MKRLLQGLSDYWDAQSELTTYFTGGIHLGTAPIEMSDPYVVVVASEGPFYTWEEALCTFTVIFMLHAGGQDVSPLVDAFDKVTKKFDNVRFPVLGWEIKTFRRQPGGGKPVKVDKMWVIPVEYESIIEKCDMITTTTSSSTTSSTTLPPTTTTS